MNPEQRRERARLAAQTRWSRAGARQAQSEAARAAWWRKLEEQVDPRAELAPAAREELVRAAGAAYMARLRMTRARKKG